MNSFFFLRPEAVGTTRAEDKHAILTQLSERFAAVYGLDASEILERMDEREKLGSTGFGRGVAIPHARVAGLRCPVAAFLRLEHPVDYESADGLPVDLVFGLLSPENAGATHLRALAAISRIVRDDATHQALADAPGADAIFALLSNVSDQDAA